MIGLPRLLALRPLCRPASQCVRSGFVSCYTVTVAAAKFAPKPGRIGLTGIQARWFAQSPRSGLQNGGKLSLSRMRTALETQASRAAVLFRGKFRKKPGFFGRKRELGNEFEEAPRQHHQTKKDGQHGSGRESGHKEGGGGGGVPSGGGGLTFRDLVLPIAIFIALNMLFDDDDLVRYVSWQEFYNKMLATGEVKHLAYDTQREVVHVILHKGAMIEGYNIGDRAGHRLPHFRIDVPNVRTFERKVEEAQAELGIHPDNYVPVTFVNDTHFTDILWSFVPVIALLGVWLFINTRFGIKSSGGSSSGGMQSPFDVNKIKPFISMDKASKVTFKDVAGLGEAKQELKEVVAFLKSPSRFVKLGAKVPKGAMLVGPPGTGKTLLAKAVAGESGVPFLAVSGSDFVEMFVGVGPARVRDLFKQAREAAPCIVYIDEIDAVARARGQSGGPSGRANSERESTLNQLLVEMDGFHSAEHILVLASTNRADMLDKALLRPGRFDRQITCDLPTLAEREDIFRVHLRKVKIAQMSDQLVSRMAALTPGMSGAQIEACCNEAALHAAREGRDAVVEEDLDYGIDRVSAGMERKSRVIQPDEKEMVAYHEAGHAVAAWLLKHADPVLKVSIIPRASSIFGHTQTMPKEHFLFNTEQLFERMVVLLAGRAAEQVMFSKVTTGAHDDLQQVTRIAYGQISRYGMTKVGPVVFDIPQRAEDGKRKVSDKLMEEADAEAKRMTDAAMAKAQELIKEHSEQLKELAQKLLKTEVLTQDDLEAVLGPRPHGAATALPGREQSSGASKSGSGSDDGGHSDNDTASSSSPSSSVESNEAAQKQPNAQPDGVV